MKKLFIIPLSFFIVAACNLKQAEVEKVNDVKVDSIQVEDDLSAKPSVEDLAPFFSEKKDANKVLIRPKSIPPNGNGVYCYFLLKSERASGLRMHIQYWGEKYADSDLYKFDIDGHIYEYIANESKGGSSSMQIATNVSFYWFDTSVDKTDQAFLEALVNSQNAKLSFVDRATDKVVSTITFSAEEKKDIERTLDYYFALNGAFIPRKGMVNIRQ